MFDVIRDLKKASTKTGVNVFKAVAEKLSAPASQRPEVNIDRIEKVSKDGEKVIVPGKVLADGTLTKKVTIVAYNASENAVKKIEAVGGKFIYLRDFVSKPDSKVRIIG
ncbi:MAG: 50S ribosomal protein L18e [Nanoarchaeota archaeon]